MTDTQVLYAKPDGSLDSFAVNPAHSVAEALAIAKAALGPDYRIIRAIHPIGGDYGYDVDRFNADHDYLRGCRMSRTVGSDTTECGTHSAYVSHGVPIILRTSV